METFKKYTTKAWNWIYERTTLWIILFMGLTFMSRLNDLTVQSSKAKKEKAECKLSCHPVSYEFIQNNQTHECWCYQDETTLTPAVLQK